MTGSHSEPHGPVSAASMLNGILEGVAIGLLAWILLRVAGRPNSSTRFAVWFFALLTIAALPVLGVAASSARAGARGLPSRSQFMGIRYFNRLGSHCRHLPAQGGRGSFAVAKPARQLRCHRCTTLDPLLREKLQDSNPTAGRIMPLRSHARAHSHWLSEAHGRDSILGPARTFRRGIELDPHPRVGTSAPPGRLDKSCPAGSKIAPVLPSCSLVD